MFYIRILFGRDLSTKVHLNCAMENIYVMYLKDKGYMIFGIMWYSHWIAWLIMLYIVYLFFHLSQFVILLSFACILNTFLIVCSLYMYQMIRNWHQTIAICAVQQTLINWFASREHLIINNMQVYEGKIAFSIPDVWIFPWPLVVNHVEITSQYVIYIFRIKVCNLMLSKW